MHLELCTVRYRLQDARQQNGQINGISGRAGGALNCVTTTPKSHRPTIDQRAVFKLHGVVTWSQVKDQQNRYYRCAFRALSFVRCKSPSVVQHAKGVRLVHTKSNEEDEDPRGLAEDRGNGPYRRQQRSASERGGERRSSRTHRWHARHHPRRSSARSPSSGFGGKSLWRTDSRPICAVECRDVSTQITETMASCQVTQLGITHAEKVGSVAHDHLEHTPTYVVQRIPGRPSKPVRD